MSNVWFSSDLHFQHANIIRLCNRPFSDINEMNEAIVANFNSLVQPDDAIYFLGDVNFKGNADNLLRRLNGKKHLVLGNHDKDFDESIFEDVCNLCEEYISIDGKTYLFVMCHYPILEWNKSHKGSIHVHGHQHNSAKYNTEQKNQGILRYDVGVDANNFYPVSAKQIVKFFDL